MATHTVTSGKQTATPPAVASTKEAVEPEPLDRQLAEQLLEQARSQGVQLVGPDGLLSKVTKTVLESALEAEMDSHLGYERNSPAGRGSGNSRNGKGGKTVMTDVGPVTLEVPRDRNGTFAPQIVPKRARRLDGFNQPRNCQPSSASTPRA